MSQTLPAHLLVSGAITDFDGNYQELIAAVTGHQIRVWDVIVSCAGLVSPALVTVRLGATADDKCHMIMSGGRSGHLVKQGRSFIKAVAGEAVSIKASADTDANALVAYALYDVVKV